MKRLILSIRNYFKPQLSEPTSKNYLREQVVANDLGQKIVLSSDDPDSPKIPSSKLKVGRPLELISYRKILSDFLKNEPRAKKGFTAVELYNWMGQSMAMSSISKTLYRMKLGGEVISEVKEGDGRIRIWKLAPAK